MKKEIIVILLGLLGLSQAVAQEYEYVPFVREGVKWVYTIYNYNYGHEYYSNSAFGNNVTYRTLELKGDTVINGKTYKAMHKYSGDAINEENDTVPIYLREEDKIVYGIIPEGVLYYYDCPVYNGFSTVDRYNGEEFIMFDFQDPVAYWDGIFAGTPYQNEYNYILLSTDTITVGNHMAKCYNGEIYHGEITHDNLPFVSFQMIDGVGLLGFNSYTLAFFLPYIPSFFGEYFDFAYLVEDGKIVYPQGYVDDRYLPVIREGVKWVNERVVVNNGVTTNYYYAYEFDGNHPEKDSDRRTFKALYSSYYNENGVNIGDAHLIAGLREEKSHIYSFRNEELNSVIADGRNLVDFYTFSPNEDVSTLYWMQGNSDGMSVIGYYINNQREPLLNTDNFVMAEPIVIDGVICSRCAYIGEQGDTLAYIVEGIGFDSYDMGDLLTPFTMKPDPNADYQEWSGLSHVVKNGEIIYKGMRYRDDVHVGIDEVVADRTCRPLDPNYYNLMGQPVGKDVPTTPGIYIHQGKKIVVR
ncbi:MAG: hypothetical protein IKX56_08120 [Muribaculaceae bacterium]|nr:hypothetical protein [Muribaculaceae bacterium]